MNSKTQSPVLLENSGSPVMECPDSPLSNAIDTRAIDVLTVVRVDNACLSDSIDPEQNSVEETVERTVHLENHDWLTLPLH